MFRCRNAMLTPTPSARRNMLAGPIKEWTFERWEYQCITFCRGQDQDRVQVPAEVRCVKLNDYFSWRLLTGHMLSCSPAQAPPPRIKLTFSDEDEIIVRL